MLTVTYAGCHKIVPYAECGYAECGYAECGYAECGYAECHCPRVSSPVSIFYVCVCIFAHLFLYVHLSLQE